MKPHEKSNGRLLEAMQDAQLLAFGPLLFHAALLLRDRGLLDLLSKNAAAGLTIDELTRESGVSHYGVTVLVEAGLAARILSLEGGRYRLTVAGQLWQRDPLTRVNADFVADVCYRAAEDLGPAIDASAPVGLRALGDFGTVYEGLSRLPEVAQKSWFAFDHFYSDVSSPLLVSDVLARRPARVLDVGANTGRFVRLLLESSPDVVATAADLPGQLELCRRDLEQAGLGARAHYHPVNLLAPDAELPLGHDIIWMSQFLSCFGESQIVHVLRTARRALGPNDRLFIVETLWDKQKNEVARLCLLATSLYFTAVANGKSRMYESETLGRLLAEAGLEIESEKHGIGWGHSLLVCRPKGP